MVNRWNPEREYSGGLLGCVKNPRADEEFDDYILRSGGDPNGDDVAHEWEFSGGGAGKLTMLFPAAMTLAPDYLPGLTQVRGDCVARAAAICTATTLLIEVYDQKADEVSGKIEGMPEIPKAGMENNIVASESLWAWRGYDRDGWTCSSAAKVACEKGFLLRKPYPELGFDLTNYSKETTRLGGSRAPGSKWLEESEKHHVRTATNVKGREQVRDFLAGGYCVFNCSSLGFASKRNEDGVVDPGGSRIGLSTKSWAHAQTFLGYDDRKSTIEKYGQPLVLWQNSWARWNKGPRRVRGTNINIPHGAYWAKASTIDRCSCIALSSVAGWPRRKLPTYGAEGNL